MIRSLLRRCHNGYLRMRYISLRSGFAIQSHLTVAERITLFLLARRCGTQICLEIGSYLGASSCFIAAGMKNRKRNGKTFCVDTWNNDAMSEGNWDTYSEFIKNTAPFGKLIIPVRGFSTDVVGQVAAQTGHLDLLFIDGDHSYEGVKADWDAYKQFLKPGSIVVFHDWGWAEGVRRVIEEDVKPAVSTFNSLPNMWWGTIKAS